MSIDAKKSKGSFDSLDEFRLHIALKVSTNQYGYEKESKILTVPYYYFSFLLDSGFDEYAWLLNIKRLSVSGFS